ncbi:hypothetical protein EHO60_04890 [Leptospira fletcheri]|uniref:Uncharacterized protein n=1 Tax=Leptospira fletcheri TaxID=2484981 RepID=A0A4R9GG97_9LEPT|nr:hypothetical protein [Leptospira fletcheri]TGK11637.1 hypothetical protein EHO60_04890 [Leptospira fletcheri]
MNLRLNYKGIFLVTLFLAEFSAIASCIAMGGTRALVRRNPEPYPTGLGIPPENEVRLNGFNFRDPSIHYGASSTMLKTGGFDGWIRSTVSLPFKDMFHTSLEGWDWSEHRIVRFEGESKGCQTGIRLVLPLKQGSRESFVPVNFVFGPTSFYEELRQKMQESSIEALFDSRLDIENTSYIFGVFRRKCIRFRSYGIQKF